MRTKNLTQEKLKNGVIYFQIGLIAALAFAYFVLEYNVKTVHKNYEVAENAKPIDETPFVFNRAEPKPEIPKSQVVKPVKQVNTPVNIEKIKIVNNTTIITKPAELASEKPNEPVETKPTEGIAQGGSGTDEPENLNILAVEELPMFENCVGLSREEQKACFDTQMQKHLNKTINYPEDAMENEEQGTILVAFVIDKQGKITNIKAMERGKKVSESLKKEAIRAISKTPKLRPGKHGNRAVNVSYMIPVTFKI